MPKNNGFSDATLGVEPPWDESAVLEVCRRHIWPLASEAYILEPYLPYVPPGWNGILVLAESQSLASAGDYVKRLNGLTPEARIRRLYDRAPDRLDVGPWDDGTIKVGLKAMLPSVGLEQTAVSNAVPWSYRGKGGSNENPSQSMKDRAVLFWRDLLAAWKPEVKALVAVGKVAKDVMTAVDLKDRMVSLRSSSRLYMNKIRGLFDTDDLLSKYTEVRPALNELGLHPEGKLYDDSVFFACHAISVGRGRLKSLMGIA